MIKSFPKVQGLKGSWGFGNSGVLPAHTAVLKASKHIWYHAPCSARTHISLQLFADSVVSPNGLGFKSISTRTIGQVLGYRHAHALYCCRQVHVCVSWNIPMAKTKRGSSEYLKIALDWQPNCHHYSFHHSYQPSGAHAVGGQSRCFHGAFHASPSAQLSRYPLISSLFLKSCPLLPFCMFISPLYLPPPPPPHLFFSSHLPASSGSTDEWDQIQRRAEDEEGRSQRKTFILYLHGQSHRFRGSEEINHSRLQKQKANVRQLK